VYPYTSAAAAADYSCGTLITENAETMQWAGDEEAPVPVVEFFFLFLFFSFVQF